MGISGVPLEKEQIINALHLKKGVIRHAAAHIACEPKTIYSWIDKDPDVANALREARANGDKERADQNEVIKVKAYTSIEALLEKGDVTSTIFALKTLCGWTQGEGNQSIQVNLNSRPYRE